MCDFCSSDQSIVSYFPQTPSYCNVLMLGYVFSTIMDTLEYDFYILQLYIIHNYHLLTFSVFFIIFYNHNFFTVLIIFRLNFYSIFYRSYSKILYLTDNRKRSSERQSIIHIIACLTLDLFILSYFFFYDIINII